MEVMKQEEWSRWRWFFVKRATWNKKIQSPKTFAIVKGNLLEDDLEAYHHFTIGEIVRIVGSDGNEVRCVNSNGILQFIEARDLVLC